MQRREFLQLLSFAAAAGASFKTKTSEAQAGAELYDVPPFGNVSLLHITDTHAQLLPVYFREPSLQLGRPVGERALHQYGIERGTALAHAVTHLDFETLAIRYGKVGGFAHLAALVKRLRASRPNALLLDGGDSWQGSATALWTRGADMMGAQQRLGVDYMTAHWEFTYGQERSKAGPIPLLAQNVRTADFEDPVFDAYAIRGGVAIVGQAFPYTPIANPRHFVPDWTFGIQEAQLQRRVDECRSKGAKAVVLLSHNGWDLDLKLAERVRGIDVILGGHTHDAVPRPVRVGSTLVTNAGTNGKFLAVLDLELGAAGVKDYRYRLLPVFSRLLEADREMAAYIDSVRAPYTARLAETLAVTEGLLYRRGNFNGTFDELVLQAQLKHTGAEIAFSPGFRWGTTLLPGEAITLEHVMDWSAITYPMTTLNEITGEQVKTILEDVADNLFNPDPYYQQGGDMVRVGGLTYACTPAERMGNRISDLRLAGKPLEADKTYRVAGWAPVAEGATGEPVWELVARYLRAQKAVAPRHGYRPRLIGVEGNPGLS